MEIGWPAQIDALAAQLRAWLSTERAARLSDAELSQIAAAARRLASLAEEVLEQRAYDRSEAEDTAEERELLEDLGYGGA
jgi:hypothetical protein